MADLPVRHINITDQVAVDQIFKDVGSDLHAAGVMLVGSDGSALGAFDTTNGVVKTAEIVTDGTLISGANGATLTGVGVLKRLMLYNGSGSAVTVEVYDNTSAAGTKLTTTIPIPTLGFLNLELNKPYALGVFIAWSTATSCQALGSSQAVA